VELKHSFTVSAPVEEAWDVLTDLKRVAACMPGAELTDVTGDEYHGRVNVRVGPFAMAYAGTARFVELDRDRHTAVVRAEGKEEKGQGAAAATIVTVLRPDGGGTVADITSTIDVSGRAAQFGRSMLADVSGRLLQQFAERLEADIRLSDASTATTAPAQSATSTKTAGPHASTAAAPTADDLTRREGASSASGPALGRASASAGAPIDALGLTAQITADRLPDLLTGLGLALGAAGLVREVRPGHRLLAGATLALAAGVALRAAAVRRAAA
jgi:carbon monoxide dehydrogenase subunit G